MDLCFRVVKFMAYTREARVCSSFTGEHIATIPLEFRSRILDLKIALEIQEGTPATYQQLLRDHEVLSDNLVYDEVCGRDENVMLMRLRAQASDLINACGEAERGKDPGDILLRYMMKNGADINRQDLFGNSALTIALG